MPIYAYKCASCGFAKDVLQKLSDAPLSQCPSCGAASFRKQLTAAGFQLKGSGWYATDFKGGNTAPPPSGEEKASSGGDAKAEGKSEAKADGGGENKTQAKTTDSSTAKKPDAAAAGGSGS
jgi:putative FmdB family regulatory protein